MAKRITYDPSQVDEFTRALREAPARAPAPLSKRAVVRNLRDPITELRERGYGWDDIAAVLHARGLPVTGTLLQTYLSRDSDKPKPKSTKKRAASTPLAAAAPRASKPASAPRSSASSSDMDTDAGWDAGPTEAPSVRPPPAPRPGPSSAAVSPAAKPYVPGTFVIRPDTPDL